MIFVVGLEVVGLDVVGEILGCVQWSFDGYTDDNDIGIVDRCEDSLELCYLDLMIMSHFGCQLDSRKEYQMADWLVEVRVYWIVWRTGNNLGLCFVLLQMSHFDF